MSIHIEHGQGLAAPSSGIIMLVATNHGLNMLGGQGIGEKVLWLKGITAGVLEIGFPLLVPTQQSQVFLLNQVNRMSLMLAILVEIVGPLATAGDVDPGFKNLEGFFGKLGCSIGFSHDTNRNRRALRLLCDKRHGGFI